MYYSHVPPQRTAAFLYESSHKKRVLTSRYSLSPIPYSQTSQIRPLAKVNFARKYNSIKYFDELKLKARGAGRQRRNSVCVTRHLQPRKTLRAKS